MGPNTFGVGNGFINLSTAFARFELAKIPVGVVGQTGGFTFGGTKEIPFVGKAVDIGNACDIGFIEVLEYFRDDPDVKIIAIYIEGLPRDGKRFLEIARQTARKKPIVVLRGGRTNAGAKVVQSHTGSLAGKNELWKAAFKQNGVIEAEDIDEVEDIVRSFLYLPLPKGKKLGVMTYPMAYGVLATDACNKYGLEIATLSPKTMANLKKLYPSWVSVGNPVDLAPPFSISGIDIDVAFKTILTALLSDTEIAGVLINTPSPELGEFYDHSQAILDIASNFDKPILPWVYCYDGDNLGIKRYEDKEIIVFSTPERALKAFSRLYDYYEWCRTSK